MECTEIFMGIMELVCKDIIPKRRTGSKSGIPRERKRLLNRLKMLKRQTHCTRKMQEKRDRKENIGDRIEDDRAQEK